MKGPTKTKPFYTKVIRKRS